MGPGKLNIHSRVWTPGPTWSVLHPGGPPLLVPLSSCTGGYGPHPRRLIRTPVQGGYPRYHSILSPPRRASLLVPLPLDLSTSLPPEFCPLLFVCFLCGTRHSTFMRNHCRLEELINSKLLKLWSWMQTQQTRNNFLGPRIKVSGNFKKQTPGVIANTDEHS